MNNSKPRAGASYAVSGYVETEIQGKKNQNPKGKLSSLEGLKQAGAVNNGDSGFYFPILNFSKF